MYDVILQNDITTPEGVRVIYVNTCRDVCSRQIAVAVKDGIILEVAFDGGCSGNTQGLARLLVGMKVTDAIERLRGIDCSERGTSCPDQLSKALRFFLP